MGNEALALTKEWYNKLQEQATNEFIALPIEYQLRGWDYNTISEHYLSFFKSDDMFFLDWIIYMRINFDQIIALRSGTIFLCFLE